MTFEEDTPQAPPITPIKLINCANDMLLRPKAIVGYPLGYRGRYIVLSHFGSVMGLHVREFEDSLAGGKFPTKRGVRLDPMQACALNFHMKEIRDISYEGKKNRTYHLGRRLFLNINQDFGTSIDLRHFFVLKEEGGSLQPTRRDVRLSVIEFEKIMISMPIIIQKWPELAKIEMPCFVAHGQQNGQQDLMNCQHCTPDDDAF